MGESSGGGGNESDNQQDDGGRRPGDPQVFGVDGVSKTGSTSKDQQIGFTDGQGGQGANFDALQGATRQQTTAAVAAADAARNAGGGDTAAQQAVRETEKASLAKKASIIPGRVYRFARPFLGLNIATRLWGALNRRQNIN